MERDYHQAMAENNTLSDQIYKLRQERYQSGNSYSLAEKPEPISEEMQELQRRNYDMMMEKYELYRHRNETLEKDNQEKTTLYSKIKTENE